MLYCAPRRRVHINNDLHDVSLPTSATTKMPYTFRLRMESVGEGEVSGGSDKSQPSAKRQCRMVEQQCLADPRELRQAILHSLNEPLVFRGYLTPGQGGTGGGEGKGGGWPCLQWDVDDWTHVFGDCELNFRIGPRLGAGESLAAPQWERESQKCVMTFEHFLDWVKGVTSCTTTCGREVNCDTHWAYFDYYYLRCLGLKCSLRDALHWGALGFPERGVENSTLWIGSPGANTPCHIDTYGCNLVAQVSGRKRWVLFPECQSRLLGATRVPYEESSVYSGAGFPRPSLHSHPSLASATPYVVTLQPGDVLFVPRHWWHSVENLELAVSINTWLEVPGDDAERVREAMVMFQVASLCQGVSSVDLLKYLFNPNMLEVATMSSASLLELLMYKVLTPRHARKAGGGGGANAQDNNGTDAGIGTNQSKWHNKEWLARHGIEGVPSMTFAQYLHGVLGLEGDKEGSGQVGSGGLEGAESEYSSDLKLLIETFTDERVIDTLKKVLEEKIESREAQCKRK